MQWYAGTSGYSYKEWKGLFYPADLPNEAMLGFYAERLPTVEINNTFYRMPKRSVVESWANAVPADFRFSIKASQRITHQKRLNDCAELVTMLAQQLEPLGDKLGAVLFQLPPHLKCDNERLDTFLALLPKDMPCAFEFRNDSWFNEPTYAALNKRGVALCLSEDGELPLPDRDTTTDWSYLRLRQPTYTEPELKSWRRRIVATDVRTAFVFFKHEDEAGGPPLAAKFLALASTPPRAAKAPRRAARRPGKVATQTGRA
jgi:uncharacterized protein YecE (DUF72 family)